MRLVELRRVSKRFGDAEVVRSLDLVVEKGEFLTLLGPSGCGKTTTLRMIAGFERPTSGEILLGGRDVRDLPPYRRDVNTVFQSYALFPHMTVAENVSYGLETKRLKRDEMRRRVDDALAMVRMADFGGRSPRELSGGQQQRVAVARAVVNDPSVLLLDEPLGALDLKLRKEMQVELKDLQRRLGMTFIYVTHDQEEALAMSDRVAVMNGGVLEQIAAPVEIYYRPRTRFVAEFVGETNLLSGAIEEAGGGALSCRLEGLGPVPIEASPEARPGARVHLSIRPEMVTVHRVDGGVPPPGEGKAALEGAVIGTVFVGSAWKTLVGLADGSRIVALEPPSTHRAVEPGTAVRVSWEPARAVILPALVR